MTLERYCLVTRKLYRNPRRIWLKRSSQHAAFGGVCVVIGGNIGKTVAGLMGPTSNHLTEILKEWNDVLQHSSLGRGPVANPIEKQEGSAPRDSRPAVGRRRKAA